MSTALIDLEDRIITDRGEVVAKHSLLMRKALSGEVFTDLPALEHPDVDDYNRAIGDGPHIETWKDDKNLEGPDPDTFEWTIPKEYFTLDLVDLLAGSLQSRGLSDNEEYLERLTTEMTLATEKDMWPFIRCMLYVTQTFREKGVVWGVGRGSSCASLLLYLLGINRVDPVKYGIPMEEFFK